MRENVNTNTNRAPIHNNVGTCTQICIHTWIYIVCSICCLLCNVVKQRSSATYVMSALGCRPKTSGVSTRGRWSITSLNNSMDLPGWCCSPCRRHRTPGTCALQTTPRDTICIHYECQTWLASVIPVIVWTYQLKRSYSFFLCIVLNCSSAIMSVPHCTTNYHQAINCPVFNGTSEHFWSNKLES